MRPVVWTSVVATSLIVACSDQRTAAKPDAAKATSLATHVALSRIEGAVDVARGTMDIVVRSAEGTVLSSTSQPYLAPNATKKRTADVVLTAADSVADYAPTAPSQLAYGESAGEFYFHTCSTTATATSFSGAVQAVNLGAADTLAPVDAVIDSISETGITLGSGSGTGSSSGTIATYSSVPLNSADCSTSTAWVFSNPSGTNFTFQAHAEGIPNPTYCPPSSQLSCAEENLECGQTGNGCGGLLFCGACTSPQTCGGGGVPGVCGAPDCTPQTCTQINASCGEQADGCGGLINCGSCIAPLTCGGGGVHNKCGAPDCIPKTCADLNVNCGAQADGCGGMTADCGSCTAPDTCGGGGTWSVCGQCGGQGAIPCSSGCNVGLSAVDGVCEPPNVLNLASINITGPVTFQGKVPWTVTASFGNNFVLYPKVPPTWIANVEPPRWMSGQGFTVTDSTPPIPPKLYVPDPSLTLQANISFTDDTDAAGVDISELRAVRNRPGRTCLETYVENALAGNHGHYAVTVQRWVDNAATCQAPLASSDPDYAGVVFNAPSPTALQGCWVDMATSDTDLYGPTAGAGSSVSASTNGTVSSTVSVPVSLPAVSNFLRYVVNVWEGDTRLGTTGAAGWSSTDPEAYGPICPGDNEQNYYNYGIQHPVASSSFSYIYALNPFQVVVQPVALAQVKVLPYTLVYMPPGNASKATFQTTTSFGISMAFDSKLSSNTSVTVDNKESDTEAAANSGSSLGSLLGGLGIGQTLSSSTSFDQSTKTGVGTILDAASSQSTTLQVITSFALSNSTLTPGSQGTYGSEPFWSDSLVLLVHPQIGLWQLSGQPVVSLLAAAGTPASPQFFVPSVGDLDACFRKVAPFAAGLPIPSTSDILTSNECYRLLQLDPFYGVGQSLPNVASNPRFVAAGATNYGIDPVSHSDLNPLFSQVLTYASTSSTQNVGSYTASITDVLSTSSAFGASLSLFGISSSDTLTNAETTTNATDWTVTLQTSYTATATSSTTTTGSFDDHHGSTGTGGLPYQPYVNVYRDTLFGSFLFQDKTAP